MIKDILKHGRIFLILVLIQVLVLNRIHFSGFINPYLYVLFLLYLPVGINRMLLMLLGFFTGMIVDIFSNTPGMHAGACVLIAYMRPMLLKAFLLKDNSNPDSCPSIHEYDIAMYIKYAISMIVVHHSFLFLIEQFDFFYFWPTLVRILLSTVATFLLILVAQLFLNIKTDRRG